MTVGMTDDHLTVTLADGRTIGLLRSRRPGRPARVELPWRPVLSAGCAAGLASRRSIGCAVDLPRSSGHRRLGIPTGSGSARLARRCRAARRSVGARQIRGTGLVGGRIYAQACAFVLPIPGEPSRARRECHSAGLARDDGRDQPHGPVLHSVVHSGCIGGEIDLQADANGRPAYAGSADQKVPVARIRHRGNAGVGCRSPFRSAAARSRTIDCSVRTGDSIRRRSRLPTDIWQGTDDHMVPAGLGQRLAAAIRVHG